jgi:hypothetical protein
LGVEGTIQIDVSGSESEGGVKVKVEMVIETTDFGEPEFRREIEKLIADIDPVNTRLLHFHMFDVTGRLNDCGICRKPYADFPT